MTASRRLAAILAIDVVGYSRLMGEDEAGTARAVREHREAARPIVADHGGRIVKTTGDGLLLEFPSVVAAVECAIAIQKLMAERNAYLVPTLVAYDALKRRGPDYGLSSYSLAKNELVLHAGLRSLEIARAAGVKIGFGSDLLGQLQNDHCNEFTIRREVMTAPDIIRSATLVNAEIVRQEGKLGELIPGAHADLLVVDGDPYRDISVFLGDGRNIASIMLGGRFIKHDMGAQ